MLIPANVMIFKIVIIQRQFRNLPRVRIVPSGLNTMSRCAVAFTFFLLFECSAEVWRDSGFFCCEQLKFYGSRAA